MDRLHGIPIIDDDVPDGHDILHPPGKGKGLVPRDYTVDPINMFADPKEIPLISKSEWSARIKELESNEASLKHIRLRGNQGNKIPSLDQGQQGYSHTSDTEVLTEKGWVRWPDYDGSLLLASVNPATHLMEFQAPTERHAYRYSDEMFYSTNRRLDFGVTRNHRMLVRKWDQRARSLSPFYTFQRADELGWYCGMMAAPAGCLGTEFRRIAVPDDREYDGDDFLALLALVVSDGYAGGSEFTKDQVSFCCFRPERREQVAALAARVGFRPQPSRSGVWTRYGCGALASWLRANAYVCGPYRSPNKMVPELVKLASMRQIRHFLDYFGDQDHNGQDKCFYSASHRIIDDLQELHLRIGKRGTISSRESCIAVYEATGQEINSGPSWVLYVSKTDRLSIDRKVNIDTDRYDDLVYCATVPNGTLVTRRNGSVLISGNCWAHSTTHAVIMQRAVANQPYVPLSAYAVACKIKNFKNEGGWCGLSAKFARETGIPSQSKWPQGDKTRSRDSAETWADAARHKIVEDWVDLTRDVYDQNLTFEMLASCLLSGIPCPVDFNWWSHSVCALNVVEVEAGSFGILILNSWSDQWEEQGMGILRGKKAIPDGALAVRSTSISSQ